MGFWSRLLGRKDRVETGGEQRTSVRAVSPLPPERVTAGGLPRHAIAGVFRGGASEPSAFEVNPEFVRLLHEVVRERAPEDAGCRAEAQRMGHGWLYVVDMRRAPGTAQVPPEDIVGYFQVEDGRLVPGSYTPNSRHLVFSDSGLVRLPGALHEALLEALLGKGVRR
jgi:hypothetical protein